MRRKPFFQEMVDENSGVARFFYKTLTLLPMHRDEAEELVETKLTAVAEAAHKQRINLRIDPEIIPRVVKLSGGHPHILQLLGSHLIEHESDGSIPCGGYATRIEHAFMIQHFTCLNSTVCSILYLPCSI